MQKNLNAIIKSCYARGWSKKVSKKLPKKCLKVIEAVLTGKFSTWRSHTGKVYCTHECESTKKICHGLDVNCGSYELGQF